MITEQTFQKLVNFQDAKTLVRQTLKQTTKDDGGEALIRFLSRYTAWNSMFAAGVAQLVANIARQSTLFVDTSFPRALADRSNYIASFFFDAARDEFDDHINRQRDPHRSLAQAMLQGVANFFDRQDLLDQKDPVWLQNLNTMAGYSGFGGGGVDEIFYGIGYHLGSEVLADQEFSMIDAYLREYEPELVGYLLHNKITLADADHRCYAWIGVHSGHGGGAEADHFAWALEGVNRALDLVQADKDKCIQSMNLGFLGFANDHRSFFSSVNHD